jgi:hypothetical protein
LAGDATSNIDKESVNKKPLPLDYYEFSIMRLRLQSFAQAWKHFFAVR